MLKRSIELLVACDWTSGRVCRKTSLCPPQRQALCRNDIFISCMTCPRFCLVVQAKKDVNQLLGRDKKKKSRPTGKRPTHRSSPEHAQAKPLSASSVLDRKPLPGIGRQSVQGRHTVDSQTSVSSPTPSDKALTLSDRSPSRTQTSSLVGHRLSQHLSVSVESEEGIRKTEDGGRKPSSLRTPVRSEEENATTPVPTALAVGLQSEQEAALKASTVYLALVVFPRRTRV